jgi:ABC-2 type transport system ATP-binding protein
VVNAVNLPAYRRFIGFLPQEFNAYPGLTAAQFLDFWMIERGISERASREATIGELLRRVGLESEGDRRVRDFSGGMRQRIGIALSLIGDPPLLIVDEPTTGLDVEARNRFRALIGDLAGDRIIVLSTHIAGDIDAVAARVLLLDRGVLRYDGSPSELRARAFGRVFETVASETEARSLSRNFRVTTRVRIGTGIRVRGVVRPGEALPGDSVAATLEEAYLAEMLRDEEIDRREVRTFGFLAET